MFTAIITKFHGATNTRGARISATSGSGHRCTISYNHAKNAEGAHLEAALTLMRKIGGSYNLQGGALKDGYAWTLS